MTSRRTQALAPLLLLGAFACWRGAESSPPEEAASGVGATSWFDNADPSSMEPITNGDDEDNEDNEADAGAEAAPPRTTPTPAKATAAADGEGRLAGITAAHNRIRGELGIAPLTWSPELAAYAQSWADKLAAGGCGLRHRPESGPDRQRYGENIFGVGGYDPSADEVVASWADEVANYDAKKNRCRGVCGHYTQIVWRKSQRLGCAMASCGDAEVWVCNYDPAGNYVGERPY